MELTPSFMGQLINFSKNAAICRVLIFIGATSNPPAWARFRKRWAIWHL
jgi:hypothetical protein